MTGDGSGAPGGFSHPLSRYAGEAMRSLFSERTRATLWRRLWLALAEAQKELGLSITEEQIAELRAHVEDVDLDDAAAREGETRHDVMAHVLSYGAQCPKARPILHLGATSAFVTDNAELVILREAMRLVLVRLVGVVRALAGFAGRWKDQPALGRTHLQPAQLTTVGKRACLWLQDFLMDVAEIERRLADLRFRGVKGTTGTQDSFLKLFDGDQEKVKALDRMVAEKMGFERVFSVTGQTYTRKVDSQILFALSGIAQSSTRLANDIRWLSAQREVEEPREPGQVGSSAMPYKRNPMRCERITALSRRVIHLALDGAHTHAAQWLERTLDDSANRRLVLPEGFLLADAILTLVRNVVSGLEVHPLVIEAHIREELPFIAMEELLMRAVQAGGDRQALHEKLRRHATAAAVRMKEEGAPNDLLARLTADRDFVPHLERAGDWLDPHRFTGRASSQVIEFLDGEVRAVLDRHRDIEDQPEDVWV